MSDITKTYMESSKLNHFIQSCISFAKQTKLQIFREESLTEVQSSAISITQKMIENDESILIPASISNTYCIEHEHYFIQFSENVVIINNGKFSYHIWLPTKKTEDLKHNFRLELERRKSIIEKKYEDQTVKNLKQILVSIT
jgi:hypothetical protein